MIFSTGANADRDLDIPGIELDGSYGAADFVSWYDGHPDVPRDLAAGGREGRRDRRRQRRPRRGPDAGQDRRRTAADRDPGQRLRRACKANPATEVHVFGRRGPAQAKFTPLELRELDHSPTIEVIVDPEDIELRRGLRRHAPQQQAGRHGRQRPWRTGRSATSATARTSCSCTSSSRPSRSSARTARSSACAPSAPSSTAPATSSGTGEFNDWDVQAVYRASATCRRTAQPAVGRRGGHRPERGRPRRSTADGDALRRRPTSPAGSSAARSASSATPRATPTRPSPTCSRTTPDCAGCARPPPRARRPSTRSSTSAACRYTTWEGWYRLDAARERPRRAAGPRARQGRRARGHAPRQRAPQGVTGAHPNQRVWRASHTRAGSAQTPPGGACWKACSTPTSM